MTLEEYLTKIEIHARATHKLWENTFHDSLNGLAWEEVLHENTEK